MVFQRESELEEAAIPFLETTYYDYRWQVPLHNRMVDLAAIDGRGHLVGIEFKLKDWRRALKQATTNANAFDYVYVCVPGGRYMERLREAARDAGVGVMVFDSDDGTVRVDVPARRVRRQWEPNHNYVRDYLAGRIVIEDH